MEDKEGDPKPGKKAKIQGAVPESPSNVSLNALLPLSVAASGMNHNFVCIICLR